MVISLFDNAIYGVEIECFGTTRPEILKRLLELGINAEIQKYNHEGYDKWKITIDGSCTSDGTELIEDLHGNMVYKGVELVSPVLKSYDGLEQLKIVCDVLEELGAKVDDTCGLHVHFNASNMTINNVKNVLIFCYNNQEILDSMMPNCRRTYVCDFCKPIALGEIRRVKKAKTREGIGRHLKTRHKIINARSYRRSHNTIEFRSHEGTIDYEEIRKWVQIINSIIEYCCSLNALLKINVTYKSEEVKLNKFLKDLGIRNSELSKYVVGRINGFKGV